MANPHIKLYSNKTSITQFWAYPSLKIVKKNINTNSNPSNNTKNLRLNNYHFKQALFPIWSKDLCRTKQCKKI